MTNTTYSLNGETNGCFDDAMISIFVNQLPSIFISTTNTLLCSGQSVILSANTAASSYSWSNGASTMSISVSPTTTTVYSITVSDGLCSASSSITQSVSACTSLSEIDNNASISVYPNPFNESFNIVLGSKNSLEEETHIYVYNTLGSMVLFTKTLENNISINTKEWNSGTYFIKVNAKAFKIIKE
jgi:hypothetical protein